MHPQIYWVFTRAHGHKALATKRTGDKVHRRQEDTRTRTMVGHATEMQPILPCIMLTCIVAVVGECPYQPVENGRPHTGGGWLLLLLLLLRLLLSGAGPCAHGDMDHA
jgi:hypothetical protein